MEGNNKTGRHLYGRGWLGLIPLVGGFVGIGLMLLGIFKYKNRKLTLIGLAALLFTVLVYFSIYYYVTYSTKARKDFAGFAQPALDNLIKNIEFYKVQHGVYPDTLHKLTAEDKFTWIHDPIPGRQDLNHGEFYYKRLGTKYYLFSSGIDKMPFTADDIFPSAAFFDSSKTGLVRPVQ